MGNLTAIGWLGYLLLISVGSFHPTTPFVSRWSQQASSAKTWGLQSDRRILFSLQSTTAPTSSNSETVPDNDDDDVEKEEKLSLNNMKQEEEEEFLIVENKKEEEKLSFDNNEEKGLSLDDSKFEEDEKLSMPWSHVQDWALRDNLPKYTVMIPLNDVSSRDEGSTQVYALWWTMLKEMPELAGYPIDFLQDMHARQIQKQDSLLEVTPALLPYLDDYEFAAAGGISGKIYGIPGLADGTRIETSAVTNIEVTLTKGFIRCADGSAAYELGLPKREAFTAAAMDKSSGSYKLLNTVNDVRSMVPQTVEGADGMLLRLGASTAVLLAGATAVSMLSHHMTVNVFWV
jgi:hypothetical protein